jgi:hypothetical protein
MLPRLHVWTTSSFVLFSTSITAQVLSRTNSGFNTPEAIQVIGHTESRVAFQDISSLSPQDVNGDGKMDLLVTGRDPATTSTGLITTLLGGPRRSVRRTAA